MFLAVRFKKVAQACWDAPSYVNRGVSQQNASRPLLLDNVARSQLQLFQTSALRAAPIWRERVPEVKQIYEAGPIAPGPNQTGCASLEPFSVNHPKFNWIIHGLHQPWLEIVLGGFRLKLTDTRRHMLGWHEILGSKLGFKTLMLTSSYILSMVSIHRHQWIWSELWPSYGRLKYSATIVILSWFELYNWVVPFQGHTLLVHGGTGWMVDLLHIGCKLDLRLCATVEPALIAFAYLEVPPTPTADTPVMDANVAVVVARVSARSCWPIRNSSKDCCASPARLTAAIRLSNLACTVARSSMPCVISDTWSYSVGAFAEDPYICKYQTTQITTWFALTTQLLGLFPSTSHTHPQSPVLLPATPISSRDPRSAEKIPRISATGPWMWWWPWRVWSVAVMMMMMLMMMMMDDGWWMMDGDAWWWCWIVMMMMMTMMMMMDDGWWMVMLDDDAG